MKTEQCVTESQELNLGPSRERMGERRVTGTLRQRTSDPLVGWVGAKAKRTHTGDQL